MLTEDQIKEALKAVKYPGFSRDIVSFGLIKQIASRDGAVSVEMQMTAPNAEVGAQIKQESERVLRELPGVKLVHVEVHRPAGAPASPQSPWSQQNKVPGIRRMVAIAIGIVGLAILFRPAEAGRAHGEAWGMAAIVGGTIAYSWGSPSASRCLLQSAK